MRPARGMGGGGFTFGGRVPPAIGALIVLTLGLSIAGALGGQSGIPLRELAVLTPELVWQGQIWRLVTWVFFENEPLSLLFTGLMLYWFGRDLAEAWGTRRFLAVYLGFAAASGAITCLIARFLWPRLLAVPYLGAWPLLDALIIGWGLLFPGRQIMLYFVLPVSSQALVWVTVGGTVLYSIFSYPGLFVPHFAAEALMFLYVRGFSMRRLWYRWQIARGERAARKRAKHLKVVDRDEPPQYLN